MQSVDAVNIEPDPMDPEIRITIQFKNKGIYYIDSVVPPLFKLGKAYCQTGKHADSLTAPRIGLISC